jgi:hypothetical protein
VSNIECWEWLVIRRLRSKLFSKRLHYSDSIRLSLNL